MPNTTIQLSADTDTKTVILNIPAYDNVTISYGTEADFTDLVERLLLLMDQDLQITLLIDGIQEGDDQKLNLVIETIREIFESYNNTFQNNSEPAEQLASEENDDLSF